MLTVRALWVSGALIAVVSTVNSAAAVETRAEGAQTARLDARGPVVLTTPGEARVVDGNERPTTLSPVIQDEVVLKTSPDAAITRPTPPSSAAAPTPARVELRSAPSPSTRAPDENRAKVQVLQDEADLAVTKTDSADPVPMGGDFYYVITTTNLGPAVAVDPTLIDTLPAALSYLSSGSSLTGPPGGVCILSGTPVFVDCSFPDMNPGDTFVLTLHVQANAGGPITNTATAATTTTDPNPSNNSASQSTMILGADLAVTKTDSADPVPVGGDFYYVITATNLGPAVAGDPTLDDTLPAGLSYLSSGSSLTGPPGGVCILSGTPVFVDCSFPDMNPGDTFVLTLHVQTSAIGTITNTATGATTTYDQNPANNFASQSTLIFGSDLAVTKTDTVDPVPVGGDFSYVITTTNLGPSSASEPSLTDTLPAELSFLSDGTSLVGPPGGSCFISGTPPVQVDCNFPDMNPGDMFVLTLHVQADAVATITNTATALTTTPEGNPANNSASESTVIYGVDIGLDKTESADPVAAGSAAGNLTYVVTATNYGVSGATGVEVQEALTLPAGVTVDSLVPSGAGVVSGSAPTYTWTIGSLAAGANETLTVTLSVGPGTAPGADVISDTATVTGVNETDLITGNDSATESTSVVTPTDVTATKIVSGDIFAGGTITYTVTLTNLGPADATDDPGVDEFTDTLPPELILIDALVTSGGGTVAFVGNTVTWNGPIPAGTSVVVEITATVDPTVPLYTEISNQGVIAFDQDGDRVNEATRLTDDPRAPGTDDPTVFAADQVPGIPALSQLGVLILVLLMAAAGWTVARRGGMV